MDRKPGKRAKKSPDDRATSDFFEGRYQGARPIEWVESLVRNSMSLPARDERQLDSSKLNEIDKAFVRSVYPLKEEQAKKAEIAVGTVIIPDKPATEGVLVKSISLVWVSVIEKLKADWNKAYEIPWRVWEELIAGGYKRAGFDEVVLTPPSGDHGRDIIAVKRGFGSVRILGSVKAYRPGHLVTHDEVLTLLGAVNIDPNASKGILTTTSGFAPRLRQDPRLAASLPHRLELIDGEHLRDWLVKLLTEPNS